MTDYGTMKTRMALELKRADLVTDGSVSNAILSALDFYKRQQFRFNQARATSNLTEDIEYYGLPADFIEMDTAVLVHNDELDFMQQRSHYWIDENKEWSQYRSRPYVVAVQADQFRVYPIPDGQTYSILITYTYELPKPSSDTDTSAWFTDGEELIRTHAKSDLLENSIRGESAFMEAQVLRRREEEIASSMRREYKRSQSAGKLTPQG